MLTSKKNKMKNIVIGICCLLFICLTIITSCSRYLDIVPDNVATIDYAFRNRLEAEKYLFTCYSYLPNYAELSNNPGLLGSDELVTNYPGAFNFSDIDPTMMEILLGLQNKVNPVADYWRGKRGGEPYFQAIRECNVFFENVNKVVDLTEEEKNRWIAEVKFLKAYYHYWLMRMYGPIPVIRENIPISATIEQVRVAREPIDVVVDYIVTLIDEATPDLPDVLFNEGTELGRITQAVALAVKADVLVTAASPLFNGNTDYAHFVNNEGVPFFNQVYSKEKWEKGVAACKAAIDLSHQLGHTLYYYTPRVATFNLSDSTLVKMNVRGSITDRWNTETIWGGSNSLASTERAKIQINSQAYLSPIGANTSVQQNLAVNLAFTDLFYSGNGVPINEDIQFDYSNRYTTLKVAGVDDRYYIKEGYTTALVNFNREPRFYATLGFDGSIWYGSGTLDDKNSYWVEAKLGQIAGNGTTTNFSITGYWPKKLVHFGNTYGSNNVWSGEAYPWPIIRLAEMYLLYAEALNETQGPSQEIYDYLDLVRKRAGLEGVVESWRKYSRVATKPSTREGLRDIIQQERMIEVAFEGKRFWDIRRWKTAPQYLNQPVMGWNINQTVTSDYYNARMIYPLSFSKRDYFWPISETNVIENPNLVQNPGW